MPWTDYPVVIEELASKLNSNHSIIHLCLNLENWFLVIWQKWTCVFLCTYECITSFGERFVIKKQRYLTRIWNDTNNSLVKVDRLKLQPRIDLKLASKLNSNHSIIHLCLNLENWFLVIWQKWTCVFLCTYECITSFGERFVIKKQRYLTRIWNDTNNSLVKVDRLKLQPRIDLNPRKVSISV